MYQKLNSNMQLPLYLKRSLVLSQVKTPTTLLSIVEIDLYSKNIES